MQVEWTWEIFNYSKFSEPEVKIFVFVDVSLTFGLAYGKVFLVKKITGADLGKLYAMKVLKKAAILQKAKTAEHIKTERQVLEAIRQIPFLVSLHYAFQSDARLHLVMGPSTLSLSDLQSLVVRLDYVSGGELFTHLNKRQHFTEQDARIYIAELTLALGQLHQVREKGKSEKDDDRFCLARDYLSRY